MPPIPAPILAAASINLSQSSPAIKIVGGQGEKYFVEYIIVPSDGSPCLELCEETKITPREMIGICKFLGMVQIASMALAAGAGFEICWSEYINELGIARHFSPGFQSADDYSSTDDVLYIFLHDPQ